MEPQSLWLVWLGVALVAGIVEITTLHLVFIMFGGGALAAAVTSAAGVHPVGQVVTFAVVSAALLGLVRPSAVRRWRRMTPQALTGVAALVGRPAEVVGEVSGRGGRVRLAGEVWTARYDGEGVLPLGLAVQVTAIEGATAVVVPVAGALPVFGAPAQDHPAATPAPAQGPPTHHPHDPHGSKDPEEGADTP